MEPLDRRIQKLDEALRAAFGFILLFTGNAAQAEELRCTPALPVFCANVHIGCSGRTTLQTQAFIVSSGKVAFSDGDEWIVDLSVSDSGAVYRKRGADDWIRVDLTGVFSQRIYRHTGPLMAYGTCKPSGA